MTKQDRNAKVCEELGIEQEWGDPLTFCDTTGCCPDDVNHEEESCEGCEYLKDNIYYPDLAAQIRVDCEECGGLGCKKYDEYECAGCQGDGCDIEVDKEPCPICKGDKVRLITRLQHELEKRGEFGKIVLSQ